MVFSSLASRNQGTRAVVITALKNSEISEIIDRGQFYLAFFPLAIGVERSIKPVIIIVQNDSQSLDAD
jgi:hypothetical protein